MKHFRTACGPFAERPFFSPQEIERMCEKELRDLKLYPVSPEPVRIDRFIEKRFNVVPTYEDLPDDVLGYTKFGQHGVEGIVVSRSLGEKGTKTAGRRARTTLSHEAGHGLLHTYLFALGKKPLPLFKGETKDAPEILCREIPGIMQKKARHDGRWWEYQANMVMGSLLLPHRLVMEASKPFLIANGTMGKNIIDPSRKEDAVRELAEIFDVNPVVARIRLDSLSQSSNGAQLEL